MIKLLQALIGLPAIAAIIYLMALNDQTIALNYYPGADALEFPVYMLMPALFAAGYLVALAYYALGNIAVQFKNYNKRKQQEKTIKNLEKELENYEQKNTIITSDEIQNTGTEQHEHKNLLRA